MVDEGSKIGDVRTVSDAACRPLVGDVVELVLHGRRVVRTIIARYAQFLWVWESSTELGVPSCLRHTLTATDWRRAIEEAGERAVLLWGGDQDIPF